MGDGTINHPLITQPLCHKNQSIGVNQLLTPLHLNALWTWLWHIWDSIWHVGGIAIVHDFCKTNDKVNLIYYWNTILCHHQFAHYYIIWNQKSKYLKIVWGVKLQCKSFAKTPTNELFKSLKKTTYIYLTTDNAWDLKSWFYLRFKLGLVFAIFFSHAVRICPAFDWDETFFYE